MHNTSQTAVASQIYKNNWFFFFWRPVYIIHIHYEDKTNHDCCLEAAAETGQYTDYSLDAVLML